VWYSALCLKSMMIADAIVFTPLPCKGDMFSGTKCNVSVLCTAPNKYTVVDPEGSIRPKFCVDIVVRHSAVSPANCNITDKFRIHLQNHTTKQVWFLT